MVRALAWMGVVAICVGAVVARIAIDESVAARPFESPGWMGVAVLGLIAWSGGAVGFARRGIGVEDVFSARPAAVAGVIIAGGAVMWLVGLKEMW